jgi:hypothetical protein
MPGFRDDFSEPPITRRSNEPQSTPESSGPEDFELYDSTRHGEPTTPNRTRYDATDPKGASPDVVDPNEIEQDATDVDESGNEANNPKVVRTARSRGVLTIGGDEVQESDRRQAEPGRRAKFASKFDEELDKSRKAKLWQHSNWVGSVVMVFILLLAYLNISSDVRGEYGGVMNNGARSGMIICSVTHGDGIVSFNLLLPDKPMMIGQIPEDKIAHNVEVLLKPRYRQNNAPDLGFKGKIDPNEINGLVQEGLHLYPVSLKKDGMASVVQQLRALIPGSNRQIDMNATHNGNMTTGKIIDGTNNGTNHNTNNSR